MIDIPSLPPSGPERGGADAERHRSTLDAATVSGEDSWAKQERERIELERQRQEAEELEQRSIAALDARSTAQLAQARTDAMKSAASVGAVGLAGFLVGGPVGAVVGVVGGWLWDSFRDPFGR